MLNILFIQLALNWRSFFFFFFNFFAPYTGAFWKKNQSKQRILRLCRHYEWVLAISYAGPNTNFPALSGLPKWCLVASVCALLLTNLQTMTMKHFLAVWLLKLGLYHQIPKVTCFFIIFTPDWFIHLVKFDALLKFRFKRLNSRLKTTTVQKEELPAPGSP